MNELPLGALIRVAPGKRLGTDRVLPILSMTMRNGLVDQAQKFNKQIASLDLSPYKVVRRGQLVVGFPIDEAVLAVQNLYPEAIVSPAYAIWDINDDRVDPRYLELFLRSGVAVAYYKAKLRGSTARRRSLPQSEFLALPVSLPPIPEQARIASILDGAASVRDARAQSGSLIDSLLRSQFESLTVRGTATLSQAGVTFSSGKSVAGVESGDSSAPRVAKVSAVSRGWFDERESKPLPTGYVPPESHRISHGHLLFTRASGSVDLIGISAFVPRISANIFLPDKLWRVELSGEASVSLPYLHALFRTDEFRSHIENESSGASGVRNISQAKVLKFVAPIPTAESLTLFDAQFTIAEALRFQTMKHLALLDELFASLQHRAFTGQL